MAFKLGLKVLPLYGLNSESLLQHTCDNTVVYTTNGILTRLVLEM